MKEQVKKKKNTKSTVSAISPEVRAVLDEYKEDMRQYVDVLLKSSSENFQRYTGALSEDFQGKVAVISEQVVSLHEKSDKLDDRFDRQEEKTDRTNDKVDVLTDKVDKIIRVQETHTEIIGTIMEDVSEIKIEVKNKANKLDVARLERRVLTLEHQ